MGNFLENRIRQATEEWHRRLPDMNAKRIREIEDRLDKIEAQLTSSHGQGYVVCVGGCDKEASP